jgi:predicted glycosyltransferase
MVTRLRQDSIRFLRRADLVVSMAGYNSISEIMRFRKKAIIVPRPGPSAEQTMRCRIMSGRGLFNTIYLQDLAAENLAALISQKLENGNGMNEAMIPDLRGASKAASLMLPAL